MVKGWGTSNPAPVFWNWIRITSWNNTIDDLGHLGLFFFLATHCYAGSCFSSLKASKKNLVFQFFV